MWIVRASADWSNNGDFDLDEENRDPRDVSVDLEIGGEENGSKW
jgi:hypothetical protein